MEPPLPDDAQSHIAFPLKNYFKDKKVKDVTVTPQQDPLAQELNRTSTVAPPPPPQPIVELPSKDAGGNNESLMVRMAREMEQDIKGPAQTGEYPAYSFQKSSQVFGKREQEIRDKIMFTKQELNQVLNQLNEFDQEHNPRRRDTLTNEQKQILEDDDMADLSFETRQLMERVLNKKRNTE